MVTQNKFFTFPARLTPLAPILYIMLNTDKIPGTSVYKISIYTSELSPASIHITNTYLNLLALAFSRLE